MFLKFSKRKNNFNQLNTECIILYTFGFCSITKWSIKWRREFFSFEYKFWFNACIGLNWMAVTIMENIFQHVAHLISDHVPENKCTNVFSTVKDHTDTHWWVFVSLWFNSAPAAVSNPLNSNANPMFAFMSFIFSGTGDFSDPFTNQITKWVSKQMQCTEKAG